MISNQLIAEIIPDLIRVEESPILNEKENIGWHSSCICRGGVVGNGTGSSRSLARSIALAEAIERSIFYRLSSENPKRFLFDEYPTTCGLAVGYDREKTRSRSISEAVERWAWSQWIDKQKFVEPVDISVKSKTAIFFTSEFDELKFYRKVIKSSLFSGGEAEWIVALGLKNGGVYAGSNLGYGENVVDHSIEEAWRCVRFTEQNPLLRRTHIINERIIFFANNADIAFKQIPGVRRQGNWTTPKLIFDETVYEHNNRVFCHRALCDDFIPWNQGPVHRFVY
ncbi:hypothetical protein [Pseudobacteriovorax antillogorgiicola]|uniref:YcaO-like family protein n=1 Tax=Pseudobacteriovorax antillogorgiicola TaxID=1513793 RepID=A0A1Y6BXK7_9BACT|nr:hypothetical protein [Pseudobacteriovorax antillogorgiicola]TCS43391.1 hypothetical protein EDD56_13731 [Pseudobacteriovorax antillogorgiicola]SMF34912.1 hypothetical protein SAMN06296036_110177 [Pseudobacteriovorax antillogorgiicola]